MNPPVARFPRTPIPRPSGARRPGAPAALPHREAAGSYNSMTLAATQKASNPPELERPALGALLERPLSLLRVGACCSLALTPLLMASTPMLLARSCRSSCMTSSSSY
eukprot:2279912-Pyramimonas_sp.AAC.1